MKALILSVSAGGGHKNAADALEEYILLQEPDSKVITIDTIKYISPFLDKMIIGTYLNSLKIYPNAFKLLFKASDSLTHDDPLFALVGKMNQFVANKLIPLIDEIKPDVMIGTHPFTAFMLQILRKKYGIDIPNSVIITDYGSHSFWVHPDIDKYFVAHEDMISELQSQGRQKEGILPLGIPIKQSFLGTFDKSQTLKKLGLNPNKKTITLMGGSLAIGNIKKILIELEAIDEDFQIIVVAANNEKVYDDALKISLNSNKDISVIKFCNYMNALLQASDLLVTKPGGLTVTEALISGTPMAIFFAIPGQEVQNAEYLLSNDLAVDIGDGSKTKEIIGKLIVDDKRLKELSEKSKLHSKPNSTVSIYNQLTDMINEYNSEEKILEREQERLELLKEKNEDSNKFSDFISGIEFGKILNKITSKLTSKMDELDTYNDPEMYFDLTEEELDDIKSDKMDSFLK